MNEKVFKKILGISSSFSFFIIFIFCFFCIGLSNVYAKSYYWNETSALSFATDIYPMYYNSKECGKTNTCYYGSSAWGTNYINSVYRVNINDANNDDYIAPGTYEINYTATFYVVGGNGSLNFNKKMFYYYTSDTDYHEATCDSGQGGSIKPTGNVNEFIFTYTCDEFNVTRSNITYMAFMFGYPDQLIYEVNITTPLRLIGEDESPNFDIIQNQNQNTQDIIDNNNSNTQDIIDNNNSNTDKITANQDKNTDKQIQENKNLLQQLFDFLIGLFIPDSFDFLTGFLDVLEVKLGFVGSVPIQFFEFLIELVNVDFDTVNSISLPKFDVFGYTFFESQEIDLSEIMATFEPYRVYTNIGCVCLCIRYLIKLYETFANGEE